MNLGIMQPYLFPYLGYFQLIGAVERFVFLDDVSFIKRGWINRNQLILSGRVGYFTVPLAEASQHQKICDIVVASEGRWKEKLDKTIRQSYGKSLYFKEVYALIESVLFGEEVRIGEMAKNSVMSVSDYLELTAQFVPTSAGYGNAALKGEARILDICRQEHASSYYNLPGGRALYDSALFAADGVDLVFVEPRLQEYRQFSDIFHPGLSILDVLMHNDPQAVREMLI